MTKATILIVTFALYGCATERFEPRTMSGAQCKMQCSTSISADLGGIPFMQKMNNCLSACRTMETLAQH